MCSACAGDYQTPDRTAPEAAPHGAREGPASSPSEALEILVGPDTLTEVYAAPRGATPAR